MGFRLGQAVEIKSHLQRDYVPSSTHSYSTRSVRHSVPFPVPQQGFITGVRTLVRTGEITQGSYGDRPVLAAEEYMKAYLVVTNIREKPWQVDPEDIVALEAF